ncbi:TonB-dependent receptor [Roseivirga thermotolerans]|uniref:TonB-dependent receptor n=1 Tax=Roseivirga thermotolerans TaxID=1758176 RepID=UPI00273F2D13|nr:TonB-dependent receptor [Roseivirga thermotolerans]
MTRKTKYLRSAAVKILSFWLFSTCCAAVFGQAESSSNEQRPLKQVLAQLESTYGVYFSYNPAEIKGLTTSLPDSTLSTEKALRQLLQDLPLSFERVKDKFYVIKKANSRFVELQIEDSETGVPLPFSTVRLKGTSKGQIANNEGVARLIIPAGKEQWLEVFFLGYQTKSIWLDTLSAVSSLKLNLYPEPLELNDYEIKEYLNPGIVADPKANSFRILPQEMEILPGLSERDVLLSAQIIAGVSSNDESASGINIRGSSRDNTLLYWNNVPIYHTAHYFGNISSFIPSSVGALDIYKNYIPVRYGGASAGLIAIQPRNSVEDKISGEISTNMTHADGFLKLPVLDKKGSLMLAARRSYNDALPTWTFNAYGRKLFENETRDRQGLLRVADFSNNLNFSDLNLQWNYEASSRSNFSIGYISAHSQFGYKEMNPQQRINIEQAHEVNSYGADLAWNHRVADRTSLAVSMAYSDYAMAYSFTNLRNPSDTSDDDTESRSNTVKNWEARVALTQRFGKGHLLSYGYQFNNLDIVNLINTQNFFEQNNAELIDSKANVHAFFSDMNLTMNQDFELVLSGRLTLLESLQKTVFSPQIKLNYNLGSHLLFKSSYGLYHQYLSTIKESQFTLSNAVEQHWLLADNEELVPLVENQQLSIGLIYNYADWLWDVDIYTKAIDGLLARNLGFGFTREDGFNQGSERIWGVDLTLRKRWKYFRTWVNYNFQDSEVSFSNLFPNSFPSSLNIRHQVGWSGTYSKGAWEFSLGYTFKTGAPYTSIDNVRLDDRRPPPPPGQGSPGDRQYKLRFSAPNSIRLPNYHRADASIWHRFKGHNWKGEVGLSFINLLNRTNTYAVSHLVDFNRNGDVDVLERTKFFLRFTPNVSLRILF